VVTQDGAGLSDRIDRLGIKRAVAVYAHHSETTTANEAAVPAAI